jgi:integrase
VVVLRGRSYYLGKFGSSQSRAEYNRIIAEYLTAGKSPPPTRAGQPATPDLTIDELILRYWTFAEGHYVRDGRPSREMENIRDALRHLRRPYGRTEAARFGPLALKAVRRSMVDAGLCRNTVNARVGKIRRLFKWAVAEEMIPPGVLEGLNSVDGLRKGRGGARESDPVHPVPLKVVEATIPFLTGPVAAMVRLQSLSGMRPGEAVAMRSEEVDRSGDVWIYRPSRHKTEGHGRTRAIPLGPKAQEVLGPFLGAADAGSYLFSPRAAVLARNERRRLARRSPMTPSQEARRKAKSQRRPPGASYSRNAYRSAIWRACDRAFPHPTLSAMKPAELTEEQRAELLAWRKAHRWHPNQLRHSAATAVRATFGVEAAQVVLGHSRADVTQVYAERDLTKAAEVMRQIG